MKIRFRAHRIAAIVVLLCAAAWVGTGDFSSVGSEEAQAAQPAPKTESAKAPTESELPTVAVIRPDFKDHARAISLSGSTAPDKHAVLAARISGVIRALPVTKGQKVDEGGLVMAIEGPEMAANVTTAKALVAQRAKELSVAEKLFKSGNQAQTQLIAKRAAKAAADAQLSQARAALDKLELRAPFAGTVDAVPVELGEWVQTGAPAATLLSLDPIVIKTAISESDVGDIRTGARAQVQLVDGRRMTGKVRFIAAEASPQTRTFPAEIALPNPEGTIPAGMTAQVTLFASPVKSVTVPRSVITLSDDGSIGLRVLDTDDVTHFAPVTLIDDTPDGLILAGVPANVRIIVSGQDLVENGQKVRAVTQLSGEPLQ